MNYIDLFNDVVSKNKTKICLVDKNATRNTTYQELGILSSRVAGKILDLKIKKGSYIVINLERSMEYIAAYLGVIKAGCVAVLTSTEYPKERIKYIIENCNASLIIRNDFFLDINSYKEVDIHSGGNEPAILLYTSGSTGKPKGIIYTCSDTYTTCFSVCKAYDGIDDIVFGATAQISFAINIMEYFTVFFLKGTVHIIPTEIVKSLSLLAKYYNDHKINCSWLIPSLVRIFPKVNDTFKMFLSGGERTSKISKRNYLVRNVYGMSESVGPISFFDIDKEYDNTPIGKGTYGVDLVVVDDKDNKVPDGIEGEICLVGNFHSYYFLDEENSKETMKIINGKTYIHSGDIGYVNENGDVLFVNRKDWMVKINGQRVETLEIENVLKEIPQIKEAVVKAFNDNGVTYLVAYYEINEEIDKTSIKNILKEKLSDYMVPSFLIQVDKLPRNVNGKIDRNSLLAPNLSILKEEFVAPSNLLEERICDSFERILACGKVGINDNFFALGGDSIKVMQLLSLLEDENVDSNLIYEGKTPKEIAKLIVNNSSFKYVHYNKKMSSYPLSESQLGVYLDLINDTNSLKYNIPFLIKINDKIDTDLFIASLKKVLLNHECLFTYIDNNDSLPKMVRKSFEINILVKEIKNIDKEIKDFIKPFDLFNGPLFRMELLKSSSETYLLCDFHHLIFDGTSLKVLIKEICDAYDGNPLKEEKLSMFDVAINENDDLRKPFINKASKIYDNLFANLDCDSKIKSDVLTDEKVSKNSVCVRKLNNRISFDKVNYFVNSNKITETSLFISAFSYCLAKFNGTNEAYFMTAHNGRNDVSFNSSIGMFVRSLPIYVSFDENVSCNDFVKNVSELYFKIKNNDYLSFSDVSNKYHISNDISFVYQSELFNGASCKDGDITPILLDSGTSSTPLNLMLIKGKDYFKVDAHYDNKIYSKELIDSFISLFEQSIIGLLYKNILSEIDLIDKKHTDLINYSFNNTEVSYSPSLLIVERFKQTAKKYPNNYCVIYKDHKYTYKEVDELTDKIASHLILKGFKSEDVIGVLINRSEYMVICPLAILKAGAAYLPLDPNYPKERLNFMVNDSNCRMIFCDKELDEVIDEKIDKIYTFEIKNIKKENVKFPLIKPSDLFVVLYTSGSTGKPKGVMYEHSNGLIVALFVQRKFNQCANSHIAAYASFGFDANVFDTYSCLISGGELHIIEEEIRLDFNLLVDYFNKNKIEQVIMTTQVGRQFAFMKGLKTLKYIGVAGEKLPPINKPENLEFSNLYGPTEGSVISTYQILDKYYKDIPIGKPVDNLKAYVVDKYQRLLTVGAIGELWISGPHVTRGYLNNPIKTNEVFVNNPFSDNKDYKRAYRTGDIVRFLPNGTIQFIGRQDGQVKIRGFRIELKEIEEVISRYPHIKDVTCVAFDDANGGKYIAGYVVSDFSIDINDLAKFIAKEKPSYMVPEIILQIDKIPLNQNQKVNKKALPIPTRKALKISKPENETQTKLFEIIKNIIGHDSFGVDSILTEVGLTSIGSLRLNLDLANAFSIPFKVSDLKENNTIRLLEEFIKKNNAINEYEILTSYPLTKTQEGIFVESLANPSSCIYNVPVLFEIDNSINTNELKKALEITINAHPYLKAKLQMNKDGGVNFIRDDDTKPIINIISLDVFDKSKLIKPFDLLNSNLYEINIIETKKQKFLYMCFHHIICDGASVQILIEDLNNAFKKQKIAKEKYSGYELAIEESNLLQSAEYSKSLHYWKNILSDVDTDCLPHFDKEDTSGSGNITLKSNLDLKIINKYLKKNEISMNAFMNGVFSFVLSRFVGKDNVLYSTIHNGRSSSMFARSVTMMVKTIPVVNQIIGEELTTTYLKRMKTYLVDALYNDAVSYIDLAKIYNLKSDIMFAYQGEVSNFDSIANKKAKFIDMDLGISKALFSLNVYLKDNHLEFVGDYRKDSYSLPFVNSFIESFEKGIMSFINSTHIKDIDLMNESSEKLYNKLNRKELIIEDVTFVDLFQRACLKNLDNKAVTCSNRTLTYRELNSWANKLAHRLIKLGIVKDDIVGTILERSVEIFVSEVGILKSGGAFLNILPSYPDERIDYCLNNAGSKVIITTRDIFIERKDLFFNKKYQVLLLEDVLLDKEINNPNIKIDKNALAYCIYTSGSTGNPKGVMIEHHNLTNLLQIEYENIILFKNKIEGSCLAGSAVSFDASIMDCLLPLAYGRHVVMTNEEEMHNPLIFNKLVLKENVKFIVGTPSYYSALVNMPEMKELFANLTTILIGGEIFTKDLYLGLRKISPNIQIINCYGPSECTVGCCQKVLLDANDITIGNSMENYKLYILDKFGHILPSYASGELIICGEGVGRGYVALKEKTNQSFFLLKGNRAYHSGDFARVNKNGEIEFAGRIDNQVKLRGYRIELDEIENVLLKYPSVKLCKVVVRNNGNEDFLAGFFTATSKVDLENLTIHLSSSLTYYMVPKVLVQLDEMPLTGNGKIDKNALPKINQVTSKKKEKRVAKKSLEEKICELFSKILNIDEVYVDDNFFELGGTSLTASKITMMLMSEEIEVSYGDIFDNPTPELLAKFIESKNISKVSEIQDKNDKSTSLTRKALEKNVVKYASEVVRKPLGNILLTGAVGFLGIHILDELLKIEKGHIYCLVRKGNHDSSLIRLKTMLFYYFSKSYEDELNNRITVIDADITDASLQDAIKDYQIDTIINSAACVKHFSDTDILNKINVLGVENLIKIACQRNIKLIQISTASVPGIHNKESYENQVKLHENELFVIDDMDNKYTISKYQAELRMFDAIENGMKGKVIRVGNLMGRHSDGEFQANFESNMFLSGIRGFATMGKYPISHMTDPMKFSPVDCTARGVVLLSGTNDMFTAFNCDNRYGFDEMKIIDSCNRVGIKIIPEKDEIYYEEYRKKLADDKVNKKLNGLAAYDIKDVHAVDTDNRFTTNILYRIGFSWPLVDDAYLDRALNSMLTLDYFDLDDE